MVDVLSVQMNPIRKDLMILNEIERLLLEDKQSAINYLARDNNQIKSMLDASDPTGSVIIKRANIEIIYNNIDIYTDLYLKLLFMSGEDAVILNYDPLAIALSYSGITGKPISEEFLIEFDPGKNVWLHISQTKNKKLFAAIKDLYLDTVYSGNLGSLFIRLCPTDNTENLDLLARIMCKYL